MSKFISSRLYRAEAYVPGEQPRDMKYNKLNTNESPFPPSPRVVKAVDEASVKALNLYSDPTCKALTDCLAAYYGIEPCNVVCGNGSDEILNFIWQAFCDDTHGVAYPDITYGLYPVLSSLYNIDSEVFPLDENFNINIEDYRNTDNHVIIANPNAPTAIAIPLSEIRKLLEMNTGRLVVVDEAYVDFGAQSAVSLIKEYSNLIVVQTFSKSRSLAGARLGAAFACKELANDINLIRNSTNPYNINRITMAAGVEAINDTEYFEKNRRTIIETRGYTAEFLQKLGFGVLPSSANFVFASNKDFDGKYLYTALKERGVLVRHFSLPRISNYLRISIGSREQMDGLYIALKEIINGEKK